MTEPSKDAVLVSLADLIKRLPAGFIPALFADLVDVANIDAFDVFLKLQEAEVTDKQLQLFCRHQVSKLPNGWRIIVGGGIDEESLSSPTTSNSQIEHFLAAAA